MGSELENLKKRFAGQKPKETDAEAAKGASAAAGGDQAASPTKTPEEIAELESKVTAQGLVVRELKANKAPAAQVTAEVGKLLDLKKELTAAKGAGGANASKAGKPKQQQKKNPANAKPKAPKAVPVKSPEEIAEINSRRRTPLMLNLRHQRLFQLNLLRKSLKSTAESLLRDSWSEKSKRRRLLPMR